MAIMSRPPLELAKANPWKTVAIIVGLFAALGGMFVMPWKAASTEDVETHKKESRATYETKAHAKEAHERIEKRQDKVDETLGDINENVIRIGERLRVGRDMRRNGERRTR